MSAPVVVRAVTDLPRNLLIGVLKLYRLVVSPLYGQVCRYFPSCSAYALEAVTVHGAVKGSWLSARRVLRCHPWAEGGLDPVPDGGRSWPRERTPMIVKLNHPHDFLPPDGQSAPAIKTTEEERRSAA
ncbi:MULTISPECIES: membrane protein insertion efficiency factor YidD [Arthrobacter]|uniref:Putative membrane protein insertion efficiency factor n=2 Tax=Arthrobacter TaxID=1663 RepID=A0ABU9KJZ5_9MICC|nr:membrane protein insertion efficiency factor YidD [Arthrobacter sp. YJM1]MDP5226871.1 membrane protein insertion efficiency factor YidD [Arthrobacter sp. YJM1]